MAKKYTSKDIFGGGSLFEGQRKDAERLLETMKDLKSVFSEFGSKTRKELVETNEKTSEGIEKITKDTKDLTDTVESFNKVSKKEIELSQEKIKLDKEQAKLDQEKAKAGQQRAKQLAELNKAQRERIKNAQETEKQTQQEIKSETEREKQRQVQLRTEILLKKERERLDKQREREQKQLEQNNRLYIQQSKRLSDLKKEYKDLVLAGRGAEKGTKALLEEITELDKTLKDLDESVGESQRKVGSYEKALESTNQALEKLDDTAKKTGIALVFLKLVELGGEFFSNSREASRETAQAFARFSESAKVFFASVVQSLGGLKLILSGTLDLITGGFSNFISSFQIGFNKFLKLALEGLNKLPTVDFSDQIAQVDQELKNLTSSTVDLTQASENLSKGIDQVKEAFSGDTDAISEAIDLTDALIDETERLEIANLDLQKGLVNLTRQQEELSLIAEDDTRGFDERIKASKDLLKVNEQVANQQEKIAGNELRLARLEVARDLVRANLITSAQALVITDKELNELLSDRAVRLKVSSDNDQAYTDAFVNFAQARTEASLTELDTEEKTRKLRSDELERDLDILIDGADRIKTINEQLISDDTISNQRRQEILNNTTKLIEDSFEKQKQTILDFGQIQIDSNSKLSEEEKKRQTEKLKNADLDSLLASKSAEELNENIRRLGLSEIFEGRLLEVINERRQSTQDLTEAQRDLNAVQRETAEINEDILDQEEALERLQNAKTVEDLEEVEKELEQQRRQNRLNAIEDELKLVEEGSKKESELIQEKNEILLDQEREALEERTALAEEEAQNLEKIYSSVFQFLGNVSDQYYDKQAERIQENIDASKKQEEQLIKQAETGVLLAEESISFERQKQQELEAERLRNEQRRARTELLLTSLEQLRANDGDLGKTITDVVALKQFVNAFPLFFDGTEDTGSGGAVDNKGGFHAILHPHERVLTRKQNERIGDLSNEELTSLAEIHNSKGYIGSDSDSINYSKEFEKLRRAVLSIPEKMPDKSFRFDQIEKAIIERTKTQGKIVNNINKTNRLF